ncbi:MAG: YceI family protein [Methylovirgula sp.]|uniref:YceI family protein n=1 Tax=Methylovirgula sp. TaxID=1978224 RepID=UPI003076257D
MKTHIFAARALTAAIAFAAVSAQAQAPARDPATVKAGTYKVEPYHTQVSFTLSHFGLSEFSGFFSGASGSLKLNPANPAADKLDVTIPVDSVLTTVPKLNDELKGDKWFDAAKYPTAEFTLTKVTLAGKASAIISGTLTLHGVTKPITLKAHLVGAGVNPIDKAYTVGFSATGTIKRSAFGVSAYVPYVGDDVHLTIAGAFELQQ